MTIVKRARLLRQAEMLLRYAEQDALAQLTEIQVSHLVSAMSPSELDAFRSDGSDAPVWYVVDASTR